MEQTGAPTQIGPYRLLALLGRGGMGDVYRARDTRLDREVALKVIRNDDGEHATHAMRLAAEARAAGRLTHPNVMAVLDVGTDGDRTYLASELVDGVSLRDLLGRPTPLPRALDLATQMADGLAAAHRAGLVHRDFKPENVMVTRSDRIVIIDFGLAKGLAPFEGQPQDRTLTAPHTVVGTVAYMSPEQARGAPVDARSDQFSFGTVFYELLTGRRAFERATSVETLASILKDEPAPVATVRDDVRPPVRWILQRCLAKSPDDRYASTDDLLHDLRAAAARSVELETPARRARTWSRRDVVAGLGAAAAVGLGWVATRRGVPAPVALPAWERLTFELGLVQAARFSRDGETVLYSASWLNQPFRVYSTTLSSPESRPLDLPPAGMLAVGPTGELAISLDCTFAPASGACAGTLARVPLLGGAPKAVATGVRAADWGPDGKLATARVDGGAGLATVEYPTGTRLSSAGTSHVRVSPDGSRVAWSAAVDTSRQGIVVHDREGDRTISADWTFISGLAWSPSGDALFVSGVHPLCADDAVVRIRLDGTTEIAVRGPARLRVLDAGPQGRLLLSQATTTARLLVWRTGAQQPRDLTWLDNSHVDAVSPDGLRLLFTVRATAVEFATALFPVFVREVDGGPATLIGSGYGVALSPDGRWALLRTRPSAGQATLVLVPLGPGEPRPLPRDGIDVGEGNSLADFAGDERLVLRAREGDGPWRTYVQALGDGPPRVLAHEPGVIVSPIAPDGDRFVAERADRSYWVSAISGNRGADIRVPLAPATRILQWTSDGRALIVATIDSPLRRSVARFDLASGRTTPLRQLGPIGDAGVLERRGLAASRDGTIVAESEVRTVGQLYLARQARS